MTSVMALDGVMPFLRLKDVLNACERMQHSQTIGGNSPVQWCKGGKTEDFKCVFIVYCVLESK